MRKKLFRQKGFSLVELMVVVAVIGILAAIGIPNYKKSRMKAYQSEAKASLANLYVAETSFYFEYNFYHTSLKAVGFLPMGRLRYNVGFGQAGFVPPDYTTVFPTSTLATKTTCTGAYGLGTDPSCNLVLDTPDITTGATVPTKDTYFATAVGYESQLLACRNPSSSPIEAIAALVILGIESQASGVAQDPSLVDGWVIDEKKMIQRRVMGEAAGLTCVSNVDCPMGTACIAGLCSARPGG